MMQMRQQGWGWTLGGLLALSTPLSAAVTYQYVTDRTSYDLSQGQSTVYVYLQESCTEGSASQIGGVGGGLNSASFVVSRTSGSSARLGGLGLNTAFDAGFPFCHTSLSSDGSTVSLEEAINIGSAGVGFTTQHPTWVLLGTLNLSVNQGGGSSWFVIGDPVPASPGDISNNQGLSLDQIAPTSASFTVVVPEPNTLVLAGGVFLVSLSKRRRRV